ncbi:bifunctional oligoribonuclease/PAP phosphatase NrnA [Clostridium sp. D2Q-14]|uniref:DHH family phosphoesterase n=1 Tax=Anaeromonas gelatinilytica TaxID=2683194 RepID=UPI00193C8170|nr:bifunctional oligoribonuclease/PAP phosphatase NrnA [Anaeromonas gelatinilytica]MBS4536004.1 bifunctional oligoribonuclease/PAP phosphatase NrnA [Anaeromonas gelatinilytica]
MNNIIRELDRSKKIYLISHINPDGDSIGSLLALGTSLQYKYMNKIVLLKSDAIPTKFNFLKNVDTLIDIDNIGDIEEDSVLITLDCGDIFRIGEFYNYIDKFKKIINIDHHVSNSGFGYINIVESDSSSTGEIVFNIIKENNLKIDKNIATALYTAISTDTGSFKYDNAKAETHRVVAELLEFNIDKNQIIQEIYQNRSIEKTNIFIESLKGLEFYCNNNIGVIIITEKMMNNINASSQDTDGIVEFIRDIESVEVACVIKEINNSKVKISLRSKKYLDVSEVAGVFNGGGHIRAAGCTIKENIDFAKEQTLKEVIKRLR